MKLSLGISPCPNDTFIFDAMLHGKINTEGLQFEYRLEDVETLNKMALNGELDITKVSYGALARLLVHYKVLDAGGALGLTTTKACMASCVMGSRICSTATATTGRTFPKPSSRSWCGMHSDRTRLPMA